MNYLLQLIRYLKQLVTQPVEELTRMQRFVRLSADMTRHCAIGLRQDRALQMAAALTYHTLFSLIPTLVLAMVILHSVVGVDERKQFQDSVVELLLPMENLEDAAKADPKRLAELSQARNELAQTVQQKMDAVSEINLETVGIVGMLVFIFGATALLGTAERSFNSILGAASSRPFFLRLPLYWAVITLGPLVMTMGQYSQAKLFELLASGRWSGWLVGPAAVVLPILATWLVFYVVYLLLPNTKVSKRAAATGSFVSTILWIVLKDLFFRLYVANAAITSLYGALALLPLFLLWLFLTWVIVLFGLEITGTLQALRGRRLESFEHQRRADLLKYGDPQWLIPIMAHIGRAFDSGKTLSRDDLADQLELPIAAVSQITARLCDAGMVHQVSNRGSQFQLALARPPEKITMASLIELADSLTDGRSDGRQDPSWEHLARLNRAKLDAVAETSLASWLNGMAESDQTDQAS